ncbi:hypothetical protein KUTeg_022572 [Tegillarca granosa]|uniref:Uncharacterized protein n=1 Tax=Tegillarca granosa TaxID=220873 RepID=A0ABQ9E6M5_TEGGR|nr:hypothetical protein KUTeg_022572 [Tegillarca granosa]
MKEYIYSAATLDSNICVENNTEQHLIVRCALDFCAFKARENRTLGICASDICIKQLYPYDSRNNSHGLDTFLEENRYLGVPIVHDKTEGPSQGLLQRLMRQFITFTDGQISQDFSLCGQSPNTCAGLVMNGLQSELRRLMQCSLYKYQASLPDTLAAVHKLQEIS